LSFPVTSLACSTNDKDQNHTRKGYSEAFCVVTPEDSTRGCFLTV
jgi:hypothetical protein